MLPAIPLPRAQGPPAGCFASSNVHRPPPPLPMIRSSGAIWMKCICATSRICKVLVSLGLLDPHNLRAYAEFCALPGPDPHDMRACCTLPVQSPAARFVPAPVSNCVNGLPGFRIRRDVGRLSQPTQISVQAPAHLTDYNDVPPEQLPVCASALACVGYTVNPLPTCFNHTMVQLSSLSLP